MKANPPAKITWIAPNGEQSEGPDITIHGEIGKEGPYKVVAENELGQDEKLVKVSIKSKQSLKQ